MLTVTQIGDQVTALARVAASYEANPALFYVGTAHGGVWKTENNGTTFEPQLQDHGLMAIGDVEISQSNPNLVWVGTGESNNRQSTSWGDGVYKSTDGGKTYTNMGLRTSRHINRIVIDPTNNDVVFVSATGSLWGPGGERGIFKTSDGGKTWKPVLTVNDEFHPFWAHDRASERKALVDFLAMVRKRLKRNPGMPLNRCRDVSRT